MSLRTRHPRPTPPPRPRVRGPRRRARTIAPLLALGLLAGAPPAPAHDNAPGNLPVSHLAGGGSADVDCLAGIEVTGVRARRRARLVACEDGDQVCDRDRLVNGRCELWLRLCFNEADAACHARGVSAVEVEGADADRDLQIVARTLAHVAMPAQIADTCAALTTFTIPLGVRPNGSPKKGRKTLALTAMGAQGAADRDQVRFVCKPPRKERRRNAITFARIQKRIFEKSCAFSGCHGVDGPRAALVLVGPEAYDNLVDRLASTAAAQFAGKKLVVPGAPTTSFLMDKLIGRLGPGEGEPMPQGRAPLGATQIEAIRKWILAGAPRERAVGGGFTGELDLQPRIPPPDPPPGGFQAALEPFLLADRPETEGCQYVRLGNPDPMFVQKWELFMHEGSHHFILYAFRCLDNDGNPVDANGDGTPDCDEPGFDDRFPDGFRPCDEFTHLGRSFVVGSQTPHFIVDYQTPITGVAFRLHRNQPLLLNSHYTNPYADTLAQVWVNATPVERALVRYPARILFETLANAFIRVPPGTTARATAPSCAFAESGLCQFAGEPLPAGDRFALLGLTSHMHKRSLKFVTDHVRADGTRIPHGADEMIDPDDQTRHLYVSTEYADPVNVGYWPPIMVERGEHFDYSCFHDNGVQTPVKLGCEETAGVAPGRSIIEQIGRGGNPFAGAAKWCASDADCAGYGTQRCVPANLVFGDLADDDMCILPGLYYRCPADAVTCLE
jgi:hypothetical protein